MDSAFGLMFGTMFAIHVWDSGLQFRFGIRFGGSGLGFVFVILVWDSDFLFTYGIKARDSCLGFRFVNQV